MTKAKVSFLICIILTVALLLCFPCCQNTAYGTSAVASDINFNEEVYLKKTDDGYFLRNKLSEYKRYDFLSINDIIEYAFTVSTGNVNIFFDQVVTDETLTVGNKSKYLSVNGQLTVRKSAPSDECAVTVTEGGINYNGLHLFTNLNGIKVEAGATLKVNSGNIEVKTTAKSQFMRWAIANYGSTIVDSGDIKYDVESVDYGVAIHNGGVNASLSVKNADSISISGWTAVSVALGKAILDGGRFTANKNSSANSSAGYALEIKNNSFVSVNGGEFSSVGERSVLISGNENATVDLNKGTINKGIKLNPRARFNLSDVTFQAPQYCALEFLPKVNATFNVVDKSNILLGAKITPLGKGYRVVGWLDGNNLVTDNEITVGSFTSGKIASPKLSNVYTVRFFDVNKQLLGSSEYEYGAQVNFSAVDYNWGFGYLLVGFCKTKDGNYIDYTVESGMVTEGDTDLYAVCVLITPTINRTENLVKVYDGTVSTITVSFSHPLAVTYEFCWQKLQDGNYVDIGNTSNILTVKGVKESGVYRLKATVIYKEERLNLTVDDVMVEISKGNHTLTEPILSGVYSRNKTLNDYVLPQNYKWADSTVIPTVTVNSYKAIYSFDSDNYNDKECDIRLILAKADFEGAPVHRDISAKYQGKKLSFYTLDEDYYWLDGNIVPTVKNNYYSAYYNDDKENYNDFPIKIKLTLQKGIYDNPILLEEQFWIYSGKSLFDLSLDPIMDGYFFNMSADNQKEIILTAKKHIFTVYYNTDRENYTDYEFLWTINVAKARYDNIISPKTFTVTYSPDLRLSALSFDVGSFWWADGSIVPTADINEYSAVYNNDSENYENFVLTVNVTVNKADYRLENLDIPTLKGVYSPNKTLSDYPLPKGYFWVDNLTPTAPIKEYRGTYCLDAINYNPLSVLIPLDIAKADISLDGVQILTQNTVYNGERQEFNLKIDLPAGVKIASLSYSATKKNGEINAGVYDIIGYFAIDDENNYNVPNKRKIGKLVIERAESIIGGESRQNHLFDGQKKYLVYSLNNKEQAVSLFYQGNSIINGISAQGSYEIIANTATSPNYKSATKVFRLNINPRSAVIGGSEYTDGYDFINGLYGEISQSDKGMDVNVTTKIILSESSANRLSLGAISVQLFLDGKEIGVYESIYRVSILLPPSLRGIKNLRIEAFNSDGNKVDFEYTVSGNYLIYVGEIDGVNIELYGEKTKQFPWLTVCLSVSGAIILLALTAFLIIKRKKKTPKAPLVAPGVNLWEETDENLEIRKDGNVEVRKDGTNDVAKNEEEINSGEKEENNENS